jgi:hypothetical protein
LDALANEGTDLRKRIVATKEGGAITGEERLREHMGYVYGAILSTEDRPTSYQMARVDVLERELVDVERDFASLQSTRLIDVNAGLKAKGLQEIIVHEAPGSMPTGGSAARQLDGLIGLHYFGRTLSRREEKERD